MKPVNHRAPSFPEDTQESDSHVMYNESFLLNSPEVKKEINMLKSVIDQRNAMIKERDALITSLSEENTKLKSTLEVQTEHFEQVREDFRQLKDKVKSENKEKKMVKEVK